MSRDMAIIQKTMDMMKYAYPALAQFPKSEKFALATDIKKSMDNVLRLCRRAQKKYTKKTTLEDLDIEVATLEDYIRLSFELGFISMHKYEVWSSMVVEIGRMLGGWLNTVKSQSQNRGK